MDSDLGWIMNWWWVTVLGPVVLIVLFAYALLARRRFGPRERAERDEATKRLYEGDGNRKEGRR